MSAPSDASLCDSSGQSLCPTCQRPLVPWPPPHEAYRGVGPESLANASTRGDRFTCRTVLCNRYGFVVRVPAKVLSRAG
jgi:hypothetical protein